MTIAKLSVERAGYTSRLSLESRWWIVAAAVVGLVVGEGTINLFCFGVFLKPLRDELGLSRGTLSSALLIASLTTALATPIAGALIDRYGSRAVMLPGIALFGVAVAARAMLQPSSIAPMYALFLLAGLSGAVQTPIIYAAIICRWFDRNRGLALGIAMAGTGLGVLIVPQMINLVVNVVGWRTAYLVLGALIFACAFLPVSLFVREPLDYRGPGATGAAKTTAAGSTLAEVVTRSWRFWCLGAAFLVGAACIFGTLAHAIAILTDREMDSRTATAAVSVAGLAMIAGRITTGYALDKVQGPSIAIVSFLVPAAGIALLAIGPAGVASFAGVVLCGLGQGAQVGLQPYFASRYFGLKSIGAISGAMFSLFLIGTGVGPCISGASFDHWTSYGPVLIGYALALSLASMLFLLLGPKPFAGSPQREIVRSMQANRSPAQ
jgi:MFS family permease